MSSGREDAEESLTKRSQSHSFTSFCKNRGTDLLSFFRWSGSENTEEVGDRTDETEG